MLNTAEAMKAINSTVRTLQKQLKHEERNGKTFHISGAKQWNKMYAKRSDIDDTYQTLYSQIVQADHTLGKISGEFEDLKGVIDTLEIEKRELQDTIRALEQEKSEILCFPKKNFSKL